MRRNTTRSHSETVTRAWRFAALYELAEMIAAQRPVAVEILELRGRVKPALDRERSVLTAP